MSEPTPGRIRLLTALVLVGVFAAGTAFGFGLMRWQGGRAWAPPPPPGPAHGLMPGPPPRELGLTPAQHAQGRAIAERHRPELEAILEEVRPRVRAVNDKMKAELRAILTPEQRQKADQLEAQRPRPRGPGFPPPGGPPPGAPPPPPPH